MPGWSSEQAAALREHIAALYSEQLARSRDPYLEEHSANSAVLLRHLAVIRRYQPFVSGRVLDWGCRHAVDACTLRFLLGDAVELHGCDVDPPGQYPAFFGYARLEYRRLTHPWQLPYPEATFDTVVGSGVLEHVPVDSESLKELWRILRPEGHLIISFLPNRRSYTEFLRRLTGDRYHRRRYALSEARRLLLHHGFEPVASGYHQVLPTLAGGGPPSLRPLVEILFRLNPLLERLPFVRSLAANLYLVGKRREVM